MKKNNNYTVRYGVTQENTQFSFYPLYEGKLDMEGIPEFIFRVIRDDENPTEGIFCTNPEKSIDPKAHVHGGYGNSQWVSTTATFVTACGWAQKEQKRIAVINTAVLDLANCQNLRSGKGMKGQTKNWAKSSQEILFLREIPAYAIKKVISLEEVNALMEWGGEFTSFNTQYEYRNKAKNRAQGDLKNAASDSQTFSQKACEWEKDFLNSNVFRYARNFWNMEACAHQVIKSK